MKVQEEGAKAELQLYIRKTRMSIEELHDTNVNSEETGILVPQYTNFYTLYHNYE